VYQSHHMLTSHSSVSHKHLHHMESYLFIAGNKANKKKKPSQADQAATETVVVSKDELRNIRTKTEKGQKSDAIFISKNELERMKESTRI
jgi:hypothetical protein